MSDAKKSYDDHVTVDFDQTNGLAGNTEGDDRGSDQSEDLGESPTLAQAFDTLVNPDSEDEKPDDPEESGYSEEGRS
jgi:hypothetical protein